MTQLEAEVVALRKQLAELEARVRLDATAERYIAGTHEVRQGDYFLLNGETPTRLDNISSCGRWTYFNGRHAIEVFGVPDHERLYTIAEVAEIVAKLKADPPL